MCVRIYVHVCVCVCVCVDFNAPQTHTHTQINLPELPIEVFPVMEGLQKLSMSDYTTGELGGMFTLHTCTYYDFVHSVINRSLNQYQHTLRNVNQIRIKWWNSHWMRVP